MRRGILLAYHVLVGVADSVLGTLLIVEPEKTLRLLGLPVPGEALPFLSLTGAFVFALGLCYLYGVMVVVRAGCPKRLEAVWVMTAIVRCSVAAFLIARVTSRVLDDGWLLVAFFDGACVVIQVAGLRLGWVAVAAE